MWALRKDRVDYRGVLYAGLMLTGGGPRVMEFNCRFGDPETQAVIPRIGGDLGDLLMCDGRGELGDAVEVAAGAAVTVVASAATATRVHRGRAMRSTASIRRAGVGGALVFHAGTRSDSGRVVTAGGRVFAVTGVADPSRAAHDVAYGAMDLITWDGRYIRRDIGHRALDTHDTRVSDR